MNDSKAAAGEPFPAGRNVLRLTPATDGLNMWSEEAVQSLIGQTVSIKLSAAEPGIDVRVTDARVVDGWVTVDTEPVR